MRRYKLAIIGCGALGAIIGEAVSYELAKNYELLGVYSRTMESALELSRKLKCKAYKNYDEIIEDRPDYIIEAASSHVIRDMGIRILESGINLIPLSLGAFANKEFYENMGEVALENNSRVYIPSGAVGGLDVLNACMMMDNIEVSITTSKSPESLAGVEYLEDRNITQEKNEQVFRGPARKAIELFPKNVNVAVATALATMGVDNTQVIINSIPNIRFNKHEIQLVSEDIKVNIGIEAKPSKTNPKSSTLAAYSVVSLLRKLVSPIVF